MWPTWMSITRDLYIFSCFLILILVIITWFSTHLCNLKDRLRTFRLFSTCLNFTGDNGFVKSISQLIFIGNKLNHQLFITNLIIVKVKIYFDVFCSYMIWLWISLFFFFFQYSSVWSLHDVVVSKLHNLAM